MRVKSPAIAIAGLVLRLRVGHKQEIVRVVLRQRKLNDVGA